MLSPLASALGGRPAERIALTSMPLGLAIAIAIMVALKRAGAPLVYLLGGWAPPLGIVLRADGLSAVMMAITAVVIGAVGVFGRTDFRTPSDSVEARAPFAFWILLLAVWGALNMVFLGGDLFTLYVALELLTFAAVPLVCLDGRAEIGVSSRMPMPIALAPRPPCEPVHMRWILEPLGRLTGPLRDFLPMPR
jgi:formate hydrogenlyase subunit 3/multisubunit Na+/H+ antiporter MnhD subunit